MHRKLAAILVADIVGYSARMERDEEGTYLDVASRRKELFEPEIVRHGGRIFKHTGDGFLAEFSSAVQAVECAVALQSALADRNGQLTSDQILQVRIGINLGEVIVEGDDVFGEGVNVAARLEPLALPGGICVSSKVAREVEKKLAFSFEPMGEKSLKNIAEPISVYRVTRDIPRHRRWHQIGRRFGARAPIFRVALVAVVAACFFAMLIWWPFSTERSGPPLLAVLPFENLSGDPAQDYLGPGVSEGIIWMLSTSPLLRVLSKTSSFSLAGSPDPRDAARALQVDYIVEGSLRRSGNTLTISAQLVDGRDGRNLWADRFENEGSDMVFMQEAVAKKVYATLAGIRGQIAGLELDQSWSKNSPSIGEYDYHLRGALEFLKWTDTSKYEAWRIWTEGLKKFPDSALLRLELAALYNNRAIDGPSIDPWQDIQRAMSLIREAEALNGRSRMEEWLLHYIKAIVLIPATGDFEAAAIEARAAHRLVPYDPLSSTDLSFVMANAGYPDTAVEWGEYAVNNETVVPDWYRDNLALGLSNGRSH